MFGSVWLHRYSGKLLFQNGRGPFLYLPKVRVVLRLCVVRNMDFWTDSRSSCVSVLFAVGRI